MKIATEASREFFDWALLDALHIEQANPDPHLDDLQLLHALEQREDEEGVCDRSWNEHGNASTYLRASAWSSLEVGTPSATNVFLHWEMVALFSCSVFFMNVKFVLLATSQLLLVASSTCLKSLFPQVTDSVMVVVASIV